MKMRKVLGVYMRITMLKIIITMIRVLINYQQYSLVHTLQKKSNLYFFIKSASSVPIDRFFIV